MTTNAQHTPGPWGAVPMVNGAKGAYYIVGNRNGNNAEVELAQVGPTLSPHADANARLIAAAPTMIDALEWIAANYENGDMNHVDFRVRAKHLADDAIALATGEPK